MWVSLWHAMGVNPGGPCSADALHEAVDVSGEVVLLHSVVQRVVRVPEVAWRHGLGHGACGEATLGLDGGTEPGSGISLGRGVKEVPDVGMVGVCLLYTSDAADEEDSVDLGGRRIIKKKKKQEHEWTIKAGSSTQEERE
eukprot:TRINITY_DN18859_c0_g1_i1.p1 TRINITY_DN18859_c0_g1~~TRINITY_DN18859_c0_g1_i1.p1  ORF type:complete len:140 (+),score=28.56 TRINITY_DN18859_c0_g1_i1:615-1034(+)